MTHHCCNFRSHLLSCVAICRYLSYLIVLSLSYHQAAQLTCVMDERLKEAAEVIDREKALKDVAMATTKEKGEATKASKLKLGDTELKLTMTDSLNLAQVDQIADLKTALEVC